ncbi:MAG: RDD family protein [Phycisphaerales bacterium]
MRLRPLIALAARLLAGAAVRAQPLPGAAGPGPAAPGHAWATLPTRAGDGSVAIIHLPPRGPRVPDGTVRMITQLPRPPERMAGWENRLYLVFGPETAGRPGAGSQRRVHILTMQPGAIEGSWAMAAEGSRLPALPSLPGEPALLGLGASELGPLALIRRAGEAPELLLLSGSAWVPLNLPGDLPAEGGLELVPSAAGFDLLAPAAGRAWSGRAALRDGSAPATWEARAIASPPGPDHTPLGGIGGGQVFWSRPSDSAPLAIHSATGAGFYPLAALRGVATDFTIAPLVRNQRIAVVWSEPMPGAEAPPAAPAAGRAGGPPPKPRPHRTRIVEVSAATGRVLYDGGAQVAGPVSSQELKLLAGLLVAVMAVILLFVLRPDQGAAGLMLPAGFALAEPTRRLIASAIDLLLVATVASRLTGAPIVDLFSPTALLTGAAPLHALFLMLGVGIVVGALCERLLGRTLGKAIAGCEVIRPVIRIADGVPVPAPTRPSLLRSMVRNLLKWVLPPVALAGAFSPERRHRGDVVSGSAVVIRLDLAEPSADEPDVEPPRG